MKNLLLKAIEDEVPVDIYCKVEDNGEKKCVLFYSAFLVTSIDESKNTFIGYDQDQRKKPIKEKIVTEESISAVCNVNFE